MQFVGQPVLTSSSTQDIGIAFSPKQKTFIHVIDGFIDNERSQVVNDLEFTGCVEAMDLVPRSWIPHDAYNATGDLLQTDGKIAVMRISNCAHPRATPATVPKPPNRTKRVTRDTMLTLRNDVYRGNLVYQGVTGILWVRNYFATKDQLKPESSAWRTTDQSGTQFKGVGTLPRERQTSERPTAAQIAQNDAAAAQARALELAHRWDPPHYEVGLQGGFLYYPAKRRELVAFVAIPDDLTNPALNPYAVGLANEFENGWNIGVSVTLNTWKWFSNNFVYSYQHGGYQYANIFTRPTVQLDEGTAGLVTREFDYNLMWNLRPPASRWRPYLAAGPSLLLTSLADATLKKRPVPSNSVCRMSACC